jgi:hypothetical protein
VPPRRAEEETGAGPHARHAAAEDAAARPPSPVARAAPGSPCRLLLACSTSGAREQRCCGPHGSSAAGETPWGEREGERGEGPAEVGEREEGEREWEGGRPAGILFNKKS